MSRGRRIHSCVVASAIALQTLVVFYYCVVFFPLYVKNMMIPQDEGGTIVSDLELGLVVAIGLVTSVANAWFVHGAFWPVPTERLWRSRVSATIGVQLVFIAWGLMAQSVLVPMGAGILAILAASLYPLVGAPTGARRTLAR